MDNNALMQSPMACSGCGACSVVCPVNAITMKEEADGCLYPRIDQASCLHCNKCADVCVFQRHPQGHAPLAAYAALGREEELVRKSASGGVFSALAKAFMQDGGKIAGAVMDLKQNSARVYHLLSDKEADLQRMQGSKYVQSEAWECYKQVQKALKEGSHVLFSGTPCQVAAVKRITGDPSNLVTMDLVCHGVPSLKMLNDFLSIFTNRLKGSLQNFSFRTKTAKRPFSAHIVTDKRDYLFNASQLSYYKLFLNGIIYRDSCYHCPYACMERVADLTMGDYWGVKEKHGHQMASGEMPERKDYSCLLVNTEKGSNFLGQYGENLQCFPSEAKWIAENNEQLNTPSSPGKGREEMLNLYKEKGYGAVEKAFVRQAGGRLRYEWRLFKKMREKG